MIDEVWCPKCKRFILIERLIKDLYEIKGLSDDVNPLNRCPYCNGKEFEVYYDKLPV